VDAYQIISFIVRRRFVRENVSPHEIALHEELGSVRNDREPEGRTVGHRILIESCRMLVTTSMKYCKYATEMHPAPPGTRDTTDLPARHKPSSGA
jgi:hypothetical protein